VRRGKNGRRGGGGKKKPSIASPPTCRYRGPFMAEGVLDGSLRLRRTLTP
jgi:hypothetical protein